MARPAALPARRAPHRVHEATINEIQSGSGWRYLVRNFSPRFPRILDSETEAMLPPDDPVDHGQITASADDHLITAVIRAVAVRADRAPEDLPPLNDVVDPDALETAFSPKPDGTPRRGGGKLVFPYAGYRVEVTADGTVSVGPLDPDR